MIKNKKGRWFYRIFYFVLILLGLFGLAFNYYHLIYHVECSQFKPSCETDQYCGIDNKCHSFPDLSTTQTITEVNRIYSILPGLFFILVSIAIAYFIIRRGRE